MCAVARPSSVVEEILRYNQGRKGKLLRRKLERMDEGPFAFFRGTDHLFARAWPEVKPADAGPGILICGDLHLENFGAYEDQDGDFRFDINDFDEALVAPCGLDLVRCATSILLAAEEWRLPPVSASGMVLAFLDHYRAAILKGEPGEISPRSGEGPIWDLLGATALGTRAQRLGRATKVTRDGTRRILGRGGRQPALGAGRSTVIRAAVEQYGRSIGKSAAYRVLDVRGRVTGIGSLGLKRYTVLVVGGGSPDRNRLLDIKEARPPSLLSCTDEPQPETGGSEARRVVEAQRRLQAKPCAGLDVLEIDGIPYRLRAMIPDENRSSLDRLRARPEKLRGAVEVVGQITAWAHIRGGASRVADVTDWASGPALDAVMVSAVRFAEVVGRDYREFHRARPAELVVAGAAESTPPRLPRKSDPRDSRSRPLSESNDRARQPS